MSQQFSLRFNNFQRLTATPCDTSATCEHVGDNEKPAGANRRAPKSQRALGAGRALRSDLVICFEAIRHQSAARRIEAAN